VDRQFDGLVRDGASSDWNTPSKLPLQLMDMAGLAAQDLAEQKLTDE
jgi:hypothetical protein